MMSGVPDHWLAIFDQLPDSAALCRSFILFHEVRQWCAIEWRTVSGGRCAIVCKGWYFACGSNHAISEERWKRMCKKR